MEVSFLSPSAGKVFIQGVSNFECCMSVGHNSNPPNLTYVSFIVMQKLTSNEILLKN